VFTCRLKQSSFFVKKDDPQQNLSSYPEEVVDAIDILVSLTASTSITPAPVEISFPMVYIKELRGLEVKLSRVPNLRTKMVS
jgi:hypothetical protein